METKRLEYFIKIVEYGNITRAAAQIGIAQPALSQQLAILESELKARLLIRTAQGVSPTPEGLVLYRHACIIVRQIEQARTGLQSAADRLSGTVSIGLPVSTGMVLSLPLLTRVRAEQPGIQLHLTEGVSGYLGELATSGRLDLALLFKTETSPGLSVHPLWNEELFLVGPKGMTFALPVHIEQLAELPMVIPGKTHAARMILEMVLGRAGLTPNVITEVDSIPTMKAAIEDGMGFTLLPWHSVRQEIAQGRIAAMSVGDAVLWRTVSLCTPDSVPLMPATQYVHNTIMELAAVLLSKEKGMTAHSKMKVSNEVTSIGAGGPKRQGRR
ncbi:MAG TPA: LysR substrate-binding domain-containing protein [Afipia sp.]